MCIENYYNDEMGIQIKESSSAYFSLSPYRKFKNIFNASFPVLFSSHNGRLFISIDDEKTLTAILSTLGQDLTSFIYSSDKEVEKHLLQALNYEESTFLKTNRMILNSTSKLSINNNTIVANESNKLSFTNTKNGLYEKYLPAIINKNVYIIIENDQVAGQGIIIRNEKNFAEVSIYINQPYRKQGFARKILSKMCSDIISQNKLVVYNVEQSNTASIKLARSLNFKTISEEKSCYRKHL